MRLFQTKVRIPDTLCSDVVAESSLPTLAIVRGVPN